MSIKGTIRRLETVVSKKHGSGSIVFVVPHYLDEKEQSEIQGQIIRDSGLTNSELLVVFVIDFAA